MAECHSVSDHGRSSCTRGQSSHLYHVNGCLTLNVIFGNGSFWWSARPAFCLNCVFSLGRGDDIPVSMSLGEMPLLLAHLAKYRWLRTTAFPALTRSLPMLTTILSQLMMRSWIRQQTQLMMHECGSLEVYLRWPVDTAPVLILV